MAVQGYVVLQFLRSGARQIHFQWQDVGPALITRDMAMPLSGRLIGTHLAFIIRQHMAPAYLILWSGIALAALAAFSWLATGFRRWSGLLLIVAAVWTSCLCIYGALNWTSDLIYPNTSERYSFASNIMLALSLVLATQSLPDSSKLRHRLSGLVTVLLAAVLLVGLWDYETYEAWVAPNAAPSWKSQIKEWDEHPGYYLQAWPDTRSLMFTLPHKR
jgi:hypothetical protein